MKLNLIFIFVCVLINRSMTHNAFESCTTPSPNLRKGECVKFQDCPELSKFRLNQLTNEERVFLFTSRCDLRDDDIFVCCEEPERNSSTHVIKKSNENTTYLPTAPVCGMDLYDGLVGTNDTQICESPWTALMEYTYPNGEKGFHCGGVLISDQYVLTAGHCVNGRGIKLAGFKLTGVRLGDWQLSTETDCDQSRYEERCSEPHQDFLVEKTVLHEDYDPDSVNQYNDIALLRLSEKIQKFTIFISPICLPIEESIRNVDLTEQKMIVNGWGSVSRNAPKDIKQKVDAKGVNLEKCQAKYDSANRILLSSQICAGGEVERDTCIGDSGGPLMRQSLSTEYPYWYLVGVLSYGPNPCGKRDWPGVYTRIDNYIDWIVSKISSQ